jgi:N-acetylglucosamine malate deacetylase 1
MHFVFALIFLLLLLILLTSLWYSRIVPQAFFYLMEKIPYPERGERILLLSPHPDDETTSAGGYISTAIKRGAEVWIVLVTDGNKRGRAQKRILEFRRACSVLGVAARYQIYWHYADGSLSSLESCELQQEIVNLAKIINPHVIVSPHLQDTHSDHAAIAQAAELVAESRKILFYQYLIHFPYFPSALKKKSDKYLLPPTRLTFNEHWFVFSLPLPSRELKQEALAGYKTPLKVPALYNLLFSFLRRNELFSVKDFS